MTKPVRDWLHDWATWAERHWTDLDGNPPAGFFGTGYRAWGVQTNQKYIGAMAVLATSGEPGPDREWALDRSRAALRFSLASHVSGEGRCTDGQQWGHTWISALGIERMMFGVELLRPHLSNGDTDALQRVLISEADWLLTSHHRGNSVGVFGGLWNTSGRNAPESNLWNGSLMWRTAALWPSHPHAALWRERACEFLVNGVSVPADETSDAVLDGRMVRDRFRGANFFPSFALDHHGYLNVGYLVICASQAAMLHFDMKRMGAEPPESLHHHQAELWDVIKRMTFADGRLARIGGDSRVRYAYCQEYLLPALCYAADQVADPHALALLDAQLRLIDVERDASGDGSFYGERLAQLAGASPYYYTRLESDRAVAIAMVEAYRPFMPGSCSVERSFNETVGGGSGPWAESTVGGTWFEPDHGAVMHRSRRRLASFAWRAHGLAQGICQPPGDGHLAEWALNLSPEIRVAGDGQPDAAPSRRLLGQHIDPFDGGFVTCGVVAEGADLHLDEGWSAHNAATSVIAVAALPDDRTMVGIHVTQAGEWRPYLTSVKGLHLNVPNDVFNGQVRQFAGPAGDIELTSPAATTGTLALGQRWTVIDDTLGVVGIEGAAELVVSRSTERRGGRYRSLYVDELCFGLRAGPDLVDPGSVFLDVGWAILAGADRKETKTFARQARAQATRSPNVRAIDVLGADGHRYVFVANIGSADARWSPDVDSINLTTGEQSPADLSLPATSALLLRKM